MKLKLLLGFGHVSPTSVTFDSIPWPHQVTALMRALQFFSIDIFAVLGVSACQLESGFHQVQLHMTVPPLICWHTPTCRRESSVAPKPLRQRCADAVLHLGFRLIYAVYVGVATRIFRLFKCRKIERALGT